MLLSHILSYPKIIISYDEMKNDKNILMFKKKNNQKVLLIHCFIAKTYFL